MKSIEEQAEDFFKVKDPMNNTDSPVDEWYFSKDDMIEFASNFAKEAVNAKLEEAIQKSNEFGFRNDYPFVEKIRNSYNEMLESLKL